MRSAASFITVIEFTIERITEEQQHYNKQDHHHYPGHTSKQSTGNSCQLFFGHLPGFRVDRSSCTFSSFRKVDIFTRQVFTGMVAAAEGFLNAESIKRFCQFNGRIVHAAIKNFFLCRRCISIIPVRDLIHIYLSNWQTLQIRFPGILFV